MTEKPEKPAKKADAPHKVEKPVSGDIVHSIYAKATSIFHPHEKVAAKIGDKPGSKSSQAPKENVISRFLHQTAAAGEKYVAKVEKAAVKYIDRLDHGKHVPNADKLTPKERSAHNVREYVDPKTHHRYHYDKVGRVDEVTGRNKSVIEVNYKDGSKSAKAENFEVYNAKGQMLDCGTASKNLKVEVDQHNGTVTTSRHDAVLNQNEKIIQTKVEKTSNADGIVTSVAKTMDGRRLEKHATGPDTRDLYHIKYQYPTKKNDQSVIAHQYDGKNELKHQFVFATPHDVEKQDATLRIDLNRSVDKGVIRETTDTFNLHQDKTNPVAKTEKVSDYTVGKITITEQGFSGKQEIERKQLSLDEMGRPQSFAYQNSQDKVNLSFDFTKNGKVTDFKGENGGFDKATLLKMAEVSIARTTNNFDVKPMDHGDLLAQRGPSNPRSGEKPTGALVYKDGNNYVQRSVEQGIVYDEKHIKIGTVNDQGEVKVGATTFNINDKNDRAAAFTGIGTDGRYLDLTSGHSVSKREEGFNGYISNGEHKMFTLGGHVFNENKKYFGNIDAAGKVDFANTSGQFEKNQTNLSSLLNENYQFTGNENGRARNFDLNRTCQGEFFLPSNNNKIGASADSGMGKSQALEVRLGMLINKETQEQIGKFTPPEQRPDGSFSEGMVELNGKKVLLSSLTNAIFNVKIDGQEQQMRGAVLGPTEKQADGSMRPGVGGIINLDAKLEASRANFEAKQKAHLEDQQKIAQQNALDGMPLNPLTGVASLYNSYDKLNNVTFEGKATAFELANKQFNSEKAAVEKMLTTGQLDDNTLFKIQKMGESNTRNEGDVRSYLLDSINNPKHVLESVPAKTHIFGELLRPDLSNPNVMHKYDIRQSIVYEKGSDKALGTVNPSDGSMRLFDDRGRLLADSLSSTTMKGSTFNFSYADQSGTNKSVAWVNDGQGQLHSVDQLRKQVAQERAYAEIMAKGTTSGENFDRLQRTIKLEERYTKALSNIVNNGIVDAGKKETGFTNLEIIKGGPKEYVRAEHDRPGRHFVGPAIQIPKLASAEVCEKTFGLMRIGHEHYKVANGQIFRTVLSSDGQWQIVPGATPCGKLEPGYKAEIDGKSVDLQSNPNFLFKMKTEGDSDEHWIMGLGETRRDATGKLISGGLIDAHEMVRRADETKKEVDRASKEYRDNETWGPLGWVVDSGYFAGRESQLNQMQGSSQNALDLQHQQIKQIFGAGLDSNNVATVDIEHSVKSMQGKLNELNLSAADAGELSRQGQNVQQGVREGTALVATTVLTGGVSSLVAAGSLTVGEGIAVTGVGGAISSSIIRQTKGGDRDQFLANAGSGGFESMLMFTGSNLAGVAKNFTAIGKSKVLLEVVGEEQHLAKFQALAKEEKLFANLEKLAKAQSAGSIQAVESAAVRELASNPQALKMAEMIARGEGAPVKALCDTLANDKATWLLKNVAVHGNLAVKSAGYAGTAANAYYQSGGFALINAAKTADSRELSLKKLSEGGVWMLAGEGAASLIHMPGGKVNIGGIKDGGMIDTFIQTMPDATINNSVNSALVARGNVTEAERENIARDLHIDVGQVTEEIFDQHKNEARMNAFIYDAAFEGAVTSVASHPFSHALAHALSEHLANQTKLQHIAESQQEYQSYISAIEAKINSAEAHSPESAARPINSELIKDMAVDNNGHISITRYDNSKVIITPEGEKRERIAIGADKEISRTTAKEGHSTEIERTDGKITTIETKGKNPNRTKIEYENGQPTKIEIFDGGHLVKEEQGWSLFLNGERQAKNVYDTIQVREDGALVKEGKSQHDGKAIREIVNADGSEMSWKDGKLVSLKSIDDSSAKKLKYTSGELTEIQLEPGVRAVKVENGWTMEMLGEKHDLCKEIVVHADGTIQFIDSIGSVRTERLDGSSSLHTPGDPIAPIDYHKEKADFQNHLSAMEDHLTAAHIREGMLSLEERLGSNKIENRQILEKVTYEVNRLLSEPGHVSIEKRRQWVDEALSLAADPIHVMQGNNPTCAFAAVELREYTLHPETCFKALRQLNETGRILQANSEVAKSFLDERGAFHHLADEEAQSSYLKYRYKKDDGSVAEAVARAGDKRLEVSQIFQSTLQEMLAAKSGGDGKVYNLKAIEPLINALTGRNETIVLDKPNSKEELAQQLLAIQKKEGQVYAILATNTNHYGPWGAGSDGIGTDGAHAQLITKFNPKTHEIEIRNTWNRASNKKLLSLESAYKATLENHSEQQLQNLERAIQRNSADPKERIDLLSWKLGFCNAATEARLHDAVNTHAENALARMAQYTNEPIDARALKMELFQAQTQLKEQLVMRESTIDGTEAGRKLSSQIDQILDGHFKSIKDQSINLRAEEKDYLRALHRMERAIAELEQAELSLLTKAMHHEPTEVGPGEAPFEAKQNNEVTHTSNTVSQAVDHLATQSEALVGRDLKQQILSKLEIKREAAHKLATTDMLIGCKNINGIVEHLDDLCQNKKGGHLIFIDVRRFKQANNMMGEKGADDALRYTAKHIAMDLGLRPDELLGRAGGDELVVALDQSRNPEEVRAKVQKLEDFRLSCKGYKTADENGDLYGMAKVRKDHKDTTQGKTEDLVIYLAVGAVSYKEGDNAHHLLNRADALMNKRKDVEEINRKAMLHHVGDLPPELAIAPPAYIADFDVTPRKYDRSTDNYISTLDLLTAKHAPAKEILVQLRHFNQLTEVNKVAFKTDIRNAIELNLALENQGKVAELRKLQTQLDKCSNLTSDQQERLIRGYETLTTRFEQFAPAEKLMYLSRREAFDQAWLNAQTGNPVKAAAQQFLRRAIERNEKFSIIVADIDNMKPVNDKRGHDEGNLLMRHAGDYLRARIPADCLIASPGGGGFTIIAPNETRREEVISILNEYGTTPDHIQGESVLKRLYRPAIELPEMKDQKGGAFELKFGFSHGYAEYNPSMIAEIKPHKIKFPKKADVEAGIPEAVRQDKEATQASISYHAEVKAQREKVVEDLLESANKSVKADKTKREVGRHRMPRIEQHEVDQAEWERRKIEDHDYSAPKPAALELLKSAPESSTTYREWKSVLYPELAIQEHYKVDTTMGAHNFFVENMHTARAEAVRERGALKHADTSKTGDMDIDRSKFIPENIPNTHRRFVREMQERIGKWNDAPADMSQEEKTKLVADRIQELQPLLNSLMQDMEVASPKLEAASREAMEGAFGEYLKGKGVVRIEEETLLHPGKFQIDVLGHEVVGHAVQEHLIQCVNALETLRAEGRKSLNDLVKKDGDVYRLTDAGKEWCARVAITDRSMTVAARTKPEVVERAFLAGIPWLEERLPKSQRELQQDNDYVAGHRLADSMTNATDRTKQVLGLLNLIQGKPHDYVLSQAQIDAVPKALAELTPVPPKDFDGLQTLKQLFNMSTQQRAEVFGYDPLAKKFLQPDVIDATQARDTMDARFMDLLKSPKFFENHPDFLTKLLSYNTESDPVARQQGKENWRQILRDANDGDAQAAPQRAVAQARLELRAYQFIMEHFEKGGSALGNLDEARFKSMFEANADKLAYKLLIDNLQINVRREHRQYLMTVHEQRARLVQDVFKQIIEKNDLQDRPGADHKIKDMLLGKVLIPNTGKGYELRNPKLRDPDKITKDNVQETVAEVKKDAPVRRIGLASMDFLARMKKLRNMQDMLDSQDSGDSLNFKENGLIPEGYMPGQGDTAGGDRELHDEDGQKQQRLQDRSTTQDRQKAGETANLTGAHDLASMPEREHDSKETTAPKDGQPLNQQALQDAAQRMEAYRLQLERNKMLRKKPDGTI